MIDRFFRTIELPLSIEQFHTLPANPAYKYEYFDGCAVLSARPKTYHAVRMLADPVAVSAFDPSEAVAIRPLREDDWPLLPELFAFAFHRVQPFASLGNDDRLDAARQCLEKARTGGEGPLVEDACFAATDHDRIVGAALITMIQRDDDVDLDEIEGDEEAPLVPHLTWIFVTSWETRRGIGSALLADVSRALVRLGHEKLASTFLIGNEASTFWHWRNGFRLISNESRLRRRIARRAARPRPTESGGSSPAT